MLVEFDVGDEGNDEQDEDSDATFEPEDESASSDEGDDSEENDQEFEPENGLASDEEEEELLHNLEDSSLGDDPQNVRIEVGEELDERAMIRNYTSGLRGSIRPITEITQQGNDGRLLLQDGHVLDLVDGNGQSFPQWYQNTLLDQYENAFIMSSPASKSRGGARKTRSMISKSDFSIGDLQLQVPQASRKSGSRVSGGKHKAVRFEEDESVSVVQDTDAQLENDSDDEDFVPSEHGCEDLMEDAQGNDLDTTSASPLSISSTLDSPDLSSPALLSSTSSSSSSELDVLSNSSHELQNLAFVSPLEIGLSSTKEQNVEGSKPVAPSAMPPGKGSKATRKRNKRRRNRKERLRRRNDATTGSESNEHRKIQLEVDHDSSAGTVGTNTSNGDINRNGAEFEAKRQQLLAAISSGGVEVSQNSNADDALLGLLSAVTPSLALSAEKGSEAPEALRTTQTEERAITGERAEVSQLADAVPLRRPKLDLASTRRMLLSSLGLQKSKLNSAGSKDENTRKEEVRGTGPSHPTPKHIIFEDDFQGERSAEITMSTKDSEAFTKDQLPAGAEVHWTEKIVLDAVECCEEGVTLSTPPFPFTQRWDPQQRLSGKKGKADKKRKRNQPQYYEEDEHYLDYGSSPKVREDNRVKPFGDPLMELNAQKASHAEGSSVVEQGLDGQPTTLLPEFSMSHDENEIPAMPSDPNTCQFLNPSDLRPGAVIGFKRLVMAANWQPEISDYQTAKLEKVLDDGTIQMILARRNRENKEISYDENGQRIYGKFEVPADDELEVDDGLLELSFSELVEPRLVQPGQELLKEAMSQDSIKDSFKDSHKDNGMPFAESDIITTQGDEQPSKKDSETDRPTNDPAVRGASEEFDFGGFDSPWESQLQLENSHRMSISSADPDLSAPVPGNSGLVAVNHVGSPAFAGLGLGSSSQAQGGDEIFATPQSADDGASPEVASGGNVAGPEKFSPEIPHSSNAEQSAQQLPSNVLLPMQPSPVDAATAISLSSNTNGSQAVKIKDSQRSLQIPGNATSDEDVQNGTSHPHDSSKAPEVVSMNLDGAGQVDDNWSDCDLPALDTVFSTFRASADPVKDEAPSSQFKFSQTSIKLSPALEVAETQLTSNSAAGMAKSSSLSSSSNHLATIVQSSSANPAGIQTRKVNPEPDIVDLTQLSDGLLMPVHEESNGRSNDELDYNGDVGLPSGPGWVDKLRPSTGRGRKPTGPVRKNARATGTASSTL